jgi:hypothetical protein
MRSSPVTSSGTVTSARVGGKTQEWLVVIPVVLLVDDDVLLLFRCTIVGVLCLLYISIRSDYHLPARSTLYCECRWNQTTVVQVSLYVVALSSTHIFDRIAHYEAQTGALSISGFATCNSKRLYKQYRLHESIPFDNMSRLTPNPSASAMSLFRFAHFQWLTLRPRA